MVICPPGTANVAVHSASGPAGSVTMQETPSCPTCCASLVEQHVVGDDLISHARPWLTQIEEEERAELDLEMQRPPRPTWCSPKLTRSQPRQPPGQ